MHSALINCQEETANNNLFASLAIELANHVFCSSFHITKDQSIVLEFNKHPSNLFCLFAPSEIQLIWNTPVKFHDLTLSLTQVSPEQLKEKILKILS